MKKRLFCTTSQSGFIMPFVLFLTIFIFILVSSSIQHYKLDIEITERHIQQLKMETLFQMGREKVKQEINAVSLPETFTYDFPDGIVRIEAKALEQDTIELFYTIEAKSNHHIYAITDTLSK